MKYDLNEWATDSIESDGMYKNIRSAMDNSHSQIPLPSGYKHTAPHGLKKMLNDFLAKLRLGMMTSVDQYSNYVNKKFHTNDYLTLTTKKHIFKNTEIQYYIDTEAEAIDEDPRITLEKYIEDHPSEMTFE